MSTLAPERPATRRARNGGVPARRAVIRWALRLLRREWRQQLLILALITVAVGGTVVGSAVATTTPSPANAGFGTAQDLAMAPGQVTAPTQVTVRFDAPGVAPADIGSTVATPQSAASGNVINPETISLAAAVLGMLLIAMVGAGGFTVLAQRRLRSIGMLAAPGLPLLHI